MDKPLIFEYKSHCDVVDQDRAIVESASGQRLEELDIDDINSFLTGMWLFMDPEAFSWTE